MKDFKLLRVKYKNIMSVGQQPIEIFLNHCANTLVTGKNGAGKSTFLEAITFALFGKPFRDVKKGQLINSSNKKDLLVELDMEFNGQLFEIRRGQKPTIFEIKRNGALIDESASAKDFQEYFEQLIGMTYNSFKQVVVLGTAGYTPFMGLTAPNRRKLVEDLLEVTVLADMDKSNKNIIRELNTSLQVVDVKIQNAQNEIKTHEEYAERQKKLSGDNLARLQTMYDEQVALAHKNKDAIIALNDEIVALVLPEDLTPKIAEKHSDAIKIQTDISGYQKVLTLYEKGGNCPVCMQHLDQGSGLVTKVRDRQSVQEQALQSVRQAHSELTEQQKEYKSVQEKIAALKRKQDALKQEAIGAAQQAKKIHGLIEQAKSEVVDNTDKINEVKSQLEKLIDHKSGIVMEKYRRGVITEMLKDSGIKGQIVKKYIPLFNKQINSYLRIMGADYSFKLNEEFSETISSRGKEDFSYSSFSQGEKARIDIAILFTWRNIASMVTGVNISTLILDEVTDGSTDAEGIKAIQTILRSLEKTNVFIISHRDHNPDDYGRHIQMKKVGRFTVME